MLIFAQLKLNPLESTRQAKLLLQSCRGEGVKQHLRPLPPRFVGTIRWLPLQPQRALLPLGLFPTSPSRNPKGARVQARPPWKQGGGQVGSEEDKIKAAMENGVLIVTVPKEEIKKTAIKSTEISG
ncbi:heat shock protein (hsp18.1) [Carex littledalei]|uniref:Heat shock protein (Hsp18.1) n=1 Tax=Carex littledalei TaxID=544730 RepID=A0A833QXF5_9POAL|nr:heat shock protein (hsp18.1) [Carex littledalei]